jgi:carnitine-CoA ligase
MSFDRTLLAPNALAYWASETPDVVALEHIDGSRLTFSELHTEARRWAGGLGALGVGPDHHVGTFLPNGFDGYRAIVSIGFHRATEVPINTAFHGRMLHHALALADVETLLTTESLARAVAEVADGLPKLATVVVLDSLQPDGALTVGAARVVGREALEGHGLAQGLAGPDVWDTAALMFTSGTTGPSKAVVCPWGLGYQGWSYAPAEAVGPGSGVYCPLPLFHIAGRGAFQCTLARGARLVTRDKFRASTLWSDVRQTSCRTMSLVGSLTSVVWSLPPRDDDADNPIEFVLLGPMIPEIESFERRFNVKVSVAYGQTEIGTPITSGWDHGPASSTGTQRTLWPFPELRLVDGHDQPVDPGEAGELVVRTREPWGINAGYYKMPEETVKAWRNGWFHTGDAMTCDEDGRFTFVDRLTDAIRRRGENISSFEVEAYVTEHPHVTECAALGVPNEHGDHDVMVFVTTAGAEFDPVDLIAYLEPRMPAFMIPRYVEVVAALPKTEGNSRVRKADLRARGVSCDTWDRDARVSR